MLSKRPRKCRSIFHFNLCPTSSSGQADRQTTPQKNDVTPRDLSRRGDDQRRATAQNMAWSVCLSSVIFAMCKKKQNKEKNRNNRNRKTQKRNRKKKVNLMLQLCIAIDK